MERLVESYYIVCSTSIGCCVMSNLFTMPLLLGFVAFMVGLLTAKFSAYIGSRAAGLEVPEHHREIRALEASLRVARKDAEETGEKLAASQQELETLHASLDNMEQTSQFHAEELEEMRQAVKGESAKVVELRRTLTDRAEETIRANVIARDSETELSVLKAGASVMYDEAGRLETGSDELADRPKTLDEELFGDLDSDESAPDDIPVDQNISDC